MSAPEPTPAEPEVELTFFFADDIRRAPARRLGWALRCRTLRNRRPGQPRALRHLSACDVRAR